MSKTKEKMFFTLKREGSASEGSRYGHAIIEIKLEDQSYGRDVLSYRWQCDNESTYWYGLRMSVESDRSYAPWEDIERAWKLAKKVSEIDYLKIIDKLVSIGIERRVYDCRLSEYIKPSEVMPENFHIYRNDQSIDHCWHVKVLARDEDEARSKMMSEWAKGIQEGYSRENKATEFAHWIQNGKPVVTQWEKFPDVQPIDQIFKLLKEPEPKMETVPALEEVAA